MKYLIALLFTSVSVFGQQAVRSLDVKVVNGDNYPKFEAVNTNTQTNPWLQFGSQTQTVFQVPANGIILPANGGTGVSSGATTNINCVAGTGRTNQLQFSSGILTNVSAVP